MATPVNCIICTESFIVDINPPMTFWPCSHNACKSCIEHWNPLERGCPLCRQIVTNVEPNRGMIDILEAIPNETIVKETSDLSNNIFCDFLRIESQDAREKQHEIIKDRCTSSIMVLDNSTSMICNYDGKKFEMKNGKLVIKEGISRWEEACCKLIEIMKYNFKRRMPTTYYHLNPKCKKKHEWIKNQDYIVVNDVMPSDDILKNFISENNVRGTTPLHDITNHCCDMLVACEIDNLCFGIIGDGEPTDKQAFEIALKKMAKKVNFFGVMVLCTDDEDTIDYFNGLDTEIGSEINGFDVIDDFDGERKEILEAGNNFIVYTYDLHICRMAGCYSIVADLLDEEYLGDNPHLTQKLCNELLKIEYRCADHNEYIKYIENILDSDKTNKYMVYDYGSDSLKPIINIKKLRSSKKHIIIKKDWFLIIQEKIDWFIIIIVIMGYIYFLLF